MEVKVIKRFRDKHDKVTYYEAGRVLELDDERAKDLIERGIVHLFDNSQKMFFDDSQNVEGIKKEADVPGSNVEGEDAPKEPVITDTDKGQEGEDSHKDDAPVQTEKVEEPVQTAVAEEAKKAAEKTVAKPKAKK